PGRSLTRAPFCFSCSVAFADHAKTGVVAGIVRHVRAPSGCSQAVEARFPTAASIAAFRSRRRPAWIHLGHSAVWLDKIVAPFPNVSRHVFEAERAGPERECAYG